MTTTTTFTDPFDMTNWGILTDFASGDFGHEAATRFVMFGAGVKYVFTGTGFTYDSNSNPTGGTITHLEVVNTTSGHDILHMGQFNLTVQQLETFAHTNDVSGFENAVLGNSGDWFKAGFHTTTQHLVGGAGDDVFNFPAGSDITTTDTFDGGGGYNTVVCSGDTVPFYTLQPGMLENIQDIKLEGPARFFGFFNDPNISGGKTLTIDAHTVGASTPEEIYTYDQTVSVNFIGGAGNDTYYGSQGDDQITGGLGQDVLSGFTGNNTFIYHSAAESTGMFPDAITDFVASKDHFQMPKAVNAMDTPLTTGTLDYNANFNTELETALNGHLRAGDAILYTPDSGNSAGFTLLIVDENGHAGYQAGHDIVIQLAGFHTDLTGFSAANFIV